MLIFWFIFFIVNTREGGATWRFKMQPCTTSLGEIAVVESDNFISIGAESIKVLWSEEHENYPGSNA